MVDNRVYIPVWRTGGVDTCELCPWIYQVCFLYSFLCSVYMETDESRDRSKSGKPGGGKRQRMWLERQGGTGMDFQNTIQ